MANEEHLARLQQGVKTWNQWRAEHPEIQPDLRVANLTRMELANIDLHDANLAGANLRQALLQGAHLRQADLQGVDLYQAFLQGADLRGVHLQGADLRGVHLHDANLAGANLRQALLQGAHLAEAKLDRADLQRVNLQGADLRQAHLAEAKLTGADLRQAHLPGAHLPGAHLAGVFLDGADLQGADFQGAFLQGAFLRRADLTRADLHQTDLRQAHLAEAKLIRADLVGAKLNKATIGWTSLGNVDLNAVQGLETVQHIGPSFIGIDTLYLSNGQIPEVFLRGAGVPENFITYIKSLVGRPFEFYSCFISYSSRDQEFAERLHADLQDKGVRCWFAPHDVQGGLKLHEQIDEAIRLHERLLLILSSYSMSSEWVKTEIAKARQREVREQRQVLFPVRLVSYDAIRDWQCFDADTGKDSAREIREYFIPDFSNWKDYDTYQKAFQRLLRDLKPNTPLL